MPTLISRTRCWKGLAPPGNNPGLRVLGIDPGLSATGFGVLSEKGTVLGYGVITTDAQHNLPNRLSSLARGISGLIKNYQPDCCAIETLFFKGGGAKSVILSAESRGAILTVLGRKRLPVFELTPATIKLAVTGSGRASKHQLNYMIRKILKLDSRVTEHAADALAVAYCLRYRITK